MVKGNGIIQKDQVSGKTVGAVGLCEALGASCYVGEEPGETMASFTYSLPGRSLFEEKVFNAALYVTLQKCNVS